MFHDLSFFVGYATGRDDGLLHNVITDFIAEVFGYLKQLMYRSKISYECSEQKGLQETGTRYRKGWLRRHFPQPSVIHRMFDEPTSKRVEDNFDETYLGRSRPFFINKQAHQFFEIFILQQI